MNMTSMMNTTNSTLLWEKPLAVKLEGDNCACLSLLHH